MSTGPSDDDDGGNGLLDKVEDVVDVVLAEDLAPPSEDPWERRGRLLDSWTAILMAVAAVATTWVSFQASQWSDVRADAQSASALLRSDSTRAAAEATSEQILDSQMWLSWLSAAGAGAEKRAEFFENRFSPALSAAQERWLAGAKLDEEGLPDPIPTGTPLDQEGYVVPASVAADDAAAAAEARLAEADVAGANSTAFVLLAVGFALSLFFVSVATKFTVPKTQVVLILAGFLLLVYGIGRILFLPHTF